MRRFAVIFGVLLLALATIAQGQPLIVPKPDAYGQPLATWTDPAPLANPPALTADNVMNLPDGTYTIKGIKAAKIVPPLNGKVVIRDCEVGRIERFVADGAPGSLELVVVNTRFTDQLSIHMQTTCTGIVVKDCSFVFPDKARKSYIYVSTKGPNYFDGVRCSGGWTEDNGQHSLDFGTTDCKLISITNYQDNGGSTSSINGHIKPGGLADFWLSNSILRSRVGMDIADVRNSKDNITNNIFLRNVEFQLNQHPIPKWQASIQALWPAHAVRNVISLGGVTYSGTGGSGWPTDPEFGSVVPKITGSLPWGADGKITTRVQPTPFTALDGAVPPPVAPPTTKPADPPPVTPPATQPAGPVELFWDATDAQGRKYRLKVTATPN